MLPRPALVLIAALAARGAIAQTSAPPLDGNMQNLLAALSQGTEVVMYTPLAGGLLQVTRFQPPMPLPRPQAEAAVAIARQHLEMLDIPNPTPDQLARALAGGSIEMRDGPQDLPGVLPAGPAIVTTQIVLGNGLPQVAAPGTPPILAPSGSAATGGSFPPRLREP